MLAVFLWGAALVAYQRAGDNDGPASVTFCARPFNDAAGKRSNPLLFQHFHKASGTLLCGFLQHMARRKWTESSRGWERRYAFKDLNISNCNLPGDSPFPAVIEDPTKQNNAGYQNKDTWDKQPNPYTLPPAERVVRYPWLAGCRERADYMRQQNIPYAGMERPFDFADACFAAFDWITILREPISRVLSHVRVHNIAPRAVLDSLSGNTGVCSAEQCPCQHSRNLPAWKCHGAHDMLVGPWVYNNFYIRTLLGESVYYLPIAAISRDHLERAKAVLRRFALVIPLRAGYLHTGFDILDMMLASDVRDRVGLHQYLYHSSASPNAKFDRRTKVLLLKYNQLDSELYAYAVKLFRTRCAQIHAKYPLGVLNMPWKTTCPLD